MLYIVSYDIPDDKRRNKISNTLLDFGDRVQFSVFECILENDELMEMNRRIKNIIMDDHDRVRVYPVCAGCKSAIQIYGKGKISEIEKVYIV